ncbi:MAG: DUF6495 family protein [Bacteroidota bacterium]
MYQSKYRRLRQDELDEMTTEFVRFLASYQITSTEWKQLKKDDPNRVDELILQFSDLIFEKVLSKVEYLILKKHRELRAFKLLDKKVKLLGLINNGDDDGNVTLDFRKNETAEDMMRQLRRTKEEIRLYAAERKYKKGKKYEAFTLMEEGALIAKDGTVYNLLDGLRKGQLN